MFRRLLRDGRGGISPLMALAAVSLCGVGALAIDVGRLQLERRRLQAATDAAALSAARAPASAVALVNGVMAANGLGAAVIQVTTGQFLDAPLVSLAQRFSVGGTPNAVQVVGTQNVPLTISQLLLGQPTAAVRTTSVAAHNPVAVFTIGSGTASLNDGLVNQLLSSLLGGNVSLSAATYNSVANSSIALFSFTDALAMRLAVTGWTYRDMLTSTAKVGEVLDVAADVLASTSPQAATAVALLAQAANSNRDISLGKLIGLNWAEARGVGTFGSDESYFNLTSNLLDFVGAAVAMGGPDSALTLSQGIVLPGLADVSVQIRLVEPPVQAGVGAAAMGVTGVRAETAQMRLLLQARLLTGANGALINLPIYVDVAPAQGELTGVSCQGSPGTDTAVEVRATTGLVRAQIGTITQLQFATVTSSPGTLPSAELLRLNLNVLGINIPVRLLATASETIASGSGNLSFTPAEITAHTVKSVSSGHLAGGLVSALGSNLVLTPVVDLSEVSPLLSATVNGLLQPLLAALLTTVRGLLLPVLSALDGPVDQLLAPLGLRLGFADIRVGGFQCGLAHLVR